MGRYLGCLCNVGAAVCVGRASDLNAGSNIVAADGDDDHDHGDGDEDDVDDS